MATPDPTPPPEIPATAPPTFVGARRGEDGDEERIGLRRWLTLVVVLTATIIVVLDNTILNVAIPTILEEFHTTLPALEWVVTGYALTFATFLIIGGRLGDLYGQRRVFIVGAGLFTAGSFLASISWNVGSLVLGEAFIEGLGASLMLPATLALLSNTFQGRGRAMAFAAWGAVAGSAAGLGPVVGGFLTTDFSWRWAFRINVIIAPLAIIGALLFIPRSTRASAREPLDVPGAALIAGGMFLLVFALSEGGTFGWLTPIADVDAGPVHVWSRSWPVAITPVLFAASAVLLAAFYVHERARERADRSPLFEFGLLHHLTFRYGLVTSAVLSMGQLGLSFALALFLQEGKGLTALQNGLWVLPYGLSILVGAPIAGKLTSRIGTTRVIRVGLVIQCSGLLYVAMRVSPSLTFLELLPGLVACGLGAGFATTQLTNVVLSEIPPTKSGVASGTNSTVRQVGSALGIATIGTLLTTLTVNHAIDTLGRARALPPRVATRAAAQVRALGANYRPAAGSRSAVSAELGHILRDAVSTATHGALLFAVAVVGAGALLSFLIPTGLPSLATAENRAAEELGALLPLDPESEILAPASN
ncbi:MAG TPA: MFS transporter [Acidimicrobiales bacterium]|nr:MFS transporter [Acidimicrobiales bacterium]